MPTAAEYQERTRTLDWEGLRSLWDRISRRDTPGWEPGKAFEHLILRAFELEGAKVSWPYVANLLDHAVEQIDGAVHADGLWCLMEAKDTTDLVGVEPIAKLRNQLLRRPAGTLGLLFSYAGFTDSALVLARFTAPHAILLWSGDEVKFLLHEKAFRRAMLVKHRRAVEHGEAFFDVRGKAL